MKKISIVLPSLVGGGAERLAIYLAKDWLQYGFNVEIVLLEKKGELLPLIGPEIRVINLKAKRIRNSIKSLSRYLTSSKPDIIWVGMWPLTSSSIISWLFAKRQGKIFLIDHNHFSQSVVNELNISPIILKICIKLTYPLANGIMAVSNGVKNDISKLGGLNKSKIRVIYNPAATGIPSKMKISEKSREDLWGHSFKKHILSVGSLTPQKNYHLLIKAFSKISKKFNAKLVILGEGKLRKSLEDLIVSLGIEDSVNLAGFTKDPYPWYLTADVYVLSSDWEGLPTVLIEALECGLPIVSTDCPSGPKEILEEGRFGKLVPTNDMNRLIHAIELSLTEEHDKDLLKLRASDFSIKNISKQYLEYFGLIGD